MPPPRKKASDGRPRYDAVLIRYSYKMHVQPRNLLRSTCRMLTSYFIPCCIENRFSRERKRYDRKNTALRSLESIKALVRITNEGQTHFSGKVITLLGRLRAQRRAVVVLVNLIDGEVLGIDVRRQLGLEGRADAAQAVPLDAAEEGMRLDLVGAVGAAVAAKTVLGVADESEGN